MDLDLVQVVRERVGVGTGITPWTGLVGAHVNIQYGVFLACMWKAVSYLYPV